MRPVVAALSLLLVAANGENGSGDLKADDGDGGGITTAGVVSVTIGALACVAILLYIFWPSLKTLWKAAPTPMVSSLPMVETARAEETETAALPSLLNAL